jgi:hypothetical protein
MDWPLKASDTVTAVIALSALITSALFAARNFRLGVITARQKYFDDVRKWADQLSDALTEAIHLCDLDPTKVEGDSFFNRRHRLRICISSMIDRGRWFFPNTEIDEHGAHKEPGYRGYRHEVLDPLVTAYICVRRINYRNGENNGFIKEELTHAKRSFVGQVQIVLDPGRQKDEFDRISDVTRVNRSQARWHNIRHGTKAGYR